MQFEDSPRPRPLLLVAAGALIDGAGRVLRGPDDVAAIVLVDRRFCDPAYDAHLPAWWREELVRCADPVPALEEFWRARSRTRAGLPSSDA